MIIVGLDTRNELLLTGRILPSMKDCENLWAKLDAVSHYKWCFLRRQKTCFPLPVYVAFY